MYASTGSSRNSKLLSSEEHEMENSAESYKVSLHPSAKIES